MTDYLSILQRYWGYTSFRGIQAEIIESIGSGHDTLGLMPTGGGKSITFQVPAMAKEGLCIVVTPLISLMKDQVEHLRDHGIQASAIHSGQPRQEIIRLLDNCILGTTKFLYVSPERLETELFLGKVRRMNVCLLVVDEAHCISQWGYDFRPSYLRIAELRKLLPDIPLLALTATATPIVADDIERRLARPGEQSDFRRFTMSFARPNLRYVVRATDDVLGEIDHILRSVSGSAIVYSRSRNGTQDLAAKLVQMGHQAIYFHAGLTPLDKSVRQRMWIDEQVRVIVATNAFGMGIDKPNVRLVIHADLPDSVEAYFQEAGRAGRDGQTAYAVCLSQRGDRKSLKQRLADEYPDADFIRRVYENLGSFYQLAVGDGRGVSYEFPIQKFCRAFKMFPSSVEGALSILTQAGYIHYVEEDTALSRVIFLMSRDELYHLHQLSPNTENVIADILRHTSGIFSQYATIYEDEIAQRTNIDYHEVYEILKSLTRQRILHYVPRKHIPKITFVQRRVETQYVELPPSVLADRKKEAERRAEAMLNYTLDDTICHSRYLLAYFGETDSPPCGHCDVCLRHKRGERYEQLAAELLYVLRSQGPKSPNDLYIAGYDHETHRRAIQYLMESERIRMADDYKLISL